MGIGGGPLPGKYLACGLGALLFAGPWLAFSKSEAICGASQTNQGGERRSTSGTWLKWTLYGQGYFSRRHGMFFLENGRLHVYSELTASSGQQANSTGSMGVTDQLKLEG